MATEDATRTGSKAGGARSKSKARTPEQVAREAFEAVAAQDFEAILAMWNPAGVQDWVALGLIRRGHDEIRQMFEEIFAATPDFGIVVERIVADDTAAVVQWRSSGTFDGAPFQGIEPNGRPIELRGVDVMQIEDGLIVRNTVYYDGAAFARSVGMLPAQDSAAERALYTAFNATTKLRRAIRERTRGEGSGEGAWSS